MDPTHRVAPGRIHHPLLGLPPPSIAQLVAEATPDAHRVVLTASKLASLRETERRALDHGYAQHQAPPWCAPPLVVATVGGAGVTRTDVTRALVTEAAELMAGVVGASEALTAARAHWRTVLTEPCEGATRISPSWAVHWTVDRIARGAEPLQLEHLVALLDDNSIRQLAALNHHYADQLITLDEAFNRTVDKLAQMNVNARRIDPAPAYFDRDGGLARLHDAASASPGVVVTGEPNSGRTSLALAWAREHGGALAINPGGVLESKDLELDHGPLPRWLMILTPSRERFEGRGGADAWDRACRAIDVYGARLFDVPRNMQIIIMATEAEHSMLVERVPVVTRFAQVALAPPSAKDAPFIWLCNALTHDNLGLASILSHLAALSDAQIRAADPTVPCSLPPDRSLSAMLRRGRPLGRRQEAAWDRLVCSNERLSDLMQLEACLRLMRGEVALRHSSGS